MRKRYLKAALILFLVVGYLSGLISTPKTANAICIRPQEVGYWHNHNPATDSITFIDVRFTCNDVIYNDQPPPPAYTLQLWGACEPTDCYWGSIPANRDSTGWIRATVDNGYAVHYIWVAAYDSTWLRVYIWTDFRDGRTDYASDEWFLR